MNKPAAVLCLLLSLISCKSALYNTNTKDSDSHFKIAFGSCNKLTIDNLLWDDITASQPDLWIWGGDNIYADTRDISKIRAKYQALKKVKGYSQLRKKIPVIGTWDDHDYGLNDGGKEFSVKKESQQEFLDFLDVAAAHPRRTREGVYAVHDYAVGEKSIRVIVLDTRYFRTSLTKDTLPNRKYRPNVYGAGTLLGQTQWKWLEEQLNTSKASFNLLVSSIQFLSDKHGFESWANFPHEVVKLRSVISSSGARGVMILSGDRHISEFSSAEIEGLGYPLIDFTSSGLTHAYTDFSGEDNPFRRGEVVAKESFGLISLQLKSGEVTFKMIGDKGEVLQSMTQNYQAPY